MKRSDPVCILSLLRVCTGSGPLQLGSHIAGVQEEHYVYLSSFWVTEILIPVWIITLLRWRDLCSCDLRKYVVKGKANWSSFRDQTKWRGHQEPFLDLQHWPHPGARPEGWGSGAKPWGLTGLSPSELHASTLHLQEVARIGRCFVSSIPGLYALYSENISVNVLKVSHFCIAQSEHKCK